MNRFEQTLRDQKSNLGIYYPYCNSQYHCHSHFLFYDAEHDQVYLCLSHENGSNNLCFDGRYNTAYSICYSDITHLKSRFY